MKRYYGRRGYRRRYRPKKYQKKKKMYKKAIKSFWGSPMSKTTPLPRTFKTTLRYQEGGLALNPGVGGLADSHVISCNGLYDPNISGTGHQPLGFDQFMLMYSHYTVIGTIIRATFINLDTTNYQTVGMYVAAITTEQADMRVLVENGSKWKVLTPKANNRDGCTFVMKINPNKWLGRSKPLAVDELRGSASSNPAEQCYFHLWASPYAQDSTDGGLVLCNVQVDYTVVFTEPKELGLS